MFDSHPRPRVWQSIEPSTRRLVMWGAADQARVDKLILDQLGVQVIALVDDTQGLASPFPGVPILQGWEGFSRWAAGQNLADVGCTVAIGNPYGHIRVALQERLREAGLAAISFADATALVSATAVFGEGLQVMPGAIVHHEARLGRACIVNTRALVEHDCVLEDGVEIGPGAVLCGRVHIGAHTWVGAGATVRQRVRIGRHAIVGAGAVVVCDIPDGVVALGVPARPIAGRVPPSAAAHAAGASV